MWAQNFQRWPPPYMGIIQYSDHLQISPYYIVDHMYDAPKITFLMRWFSGVWPWCSRSSARRPVYTGGSTWQRWSIEFSIEQLWKVKWKTLQVQTGDRWYYKVSSTLGFGSMVLLIFQCGPFCIVAQYVLYLSIDGQCHIFPYRQCHIFPCGQCHYWIPLNTIAISIWC